MHRNPFANFLYWSKVIHPPWCGDCPLSDHNQKQGSSTSIQDSEISLTATSQCNGQNNQTAEPNFFLRSTINASWILSVRIELELYSFNGAAQLAGHPWRANHAEHRTRVEREGSPCVQYTRQKSLWYTALLAVSNKSRMRNSTMLKDRGANKRHVPNKTIRRAKLLDAIFWCYDMLEEQWMEGWKRAASLFVVTVTLSWER